MVCSVKTRVRTGAMVGSQLFYRANIQDDKRTDFNPITILKFHLLHQGSAKEIPSLFVARV